jgi:carbonic anhydrase
VEIIDEFIERNKQFAQKQFKATLKMLPSRRTMIIGCVDPRVDPSDIFGIALGEAAVIRNVGGRVTPDILHTLGLLRVVSGANGAEVGAGWNLIVLHHTDCGIRCLGGARPQLADYLGVTPADLPTMAIDDPRQSVAMDIAKMRTITRLPGALAVTGMVYDVSTGLVDEVVPTSLLHEAASQ